MIQDSRPDCFAVFPANGGAILPAELQCSLADVGTWLKEVKIIIMLEAIEFDLFIPVGCAVRGVSRMSKHPGNSRPGHVLPT